MQQTIITRQSPAPMDAGVEKRKKSRYTGTAHQAAGRGTTGPVHISRC